MIVTIASGSSKNFTFDITESMQTMTAYIVEFTSGDAGSGTIGYYSLYAVGLTLFVFTLVMNMVAQYISRNLGRDIKMKLEGNRRTTYRLWLNRILKNVFFASTLLALVVLMVLIYQVVTQSIGWLDWTS